ncbi:MAG: restriction endonuclease subunit S [Melioribacteraceae bacterium]
MLNKETKKKIDNCRDILVGVLPLPSDQVELITISLIYKFMDDMDEQSRQPGGAVSFFRNGLKVYSWQNLMSNQLSADERVLKFIKAIEELTKAPHIPELFKSIFRNTFLKFRDGRVFKLFLDEINYFSYDNSEELGNAFEYLLNTMGAQGENGQFRTPRNIIDFIVEVVDPDKDDKILDPACGTAGFLISAYKHILRKYTTGYENYRVSLNNQTLESNGIHWGDKLLASQKSKLSKRIEGYDNTPLMVRLSQVNMYLHHFANPAIYDYDSITYSNRWSDKYDCILANPPFMTPKGGVKAHDQFRIRANKTEILFSDYIIEHLTPNGKAGWIVPEGIIFQNSNDYVELRKWLINEMGLWAVVSLPAQIFQPYSGVKTSILLIDRALARLTENIILVKIENDGFSLNTNRNPIQENDLPAALNLLTEYKKNPSVILSRSSERSEEEAKNLKYKILHRKDFAKLDSYKSTTAAIDFCKKEFKDLKKAEEKYQESLQKELTEKQKQKADERIKNLRRLLLINTGFNTIPMYETLIKQLIEEQLKDQVILYGEDSENRVNLSSNLKKAIDWQREYNLSFDKNSNIKKGPSADWEMKRIGDLCELINGRAFKPSDWTTKEDGGLPIIRIQNLNNEFAEFNYYTGVVVEKFIVNNGDLLFSWSGSKGSSFGPHIWNGGKAILNQHIFRIEHTRNIIKEYFYWALKKLVVEVEENLHGGVGLVHITKGDLEELQIPVPPLEVQQKIVSEIEQYQKVIDGCNLVIKNYKPTFKIDESWEKVKLGDYCDLLTGATPRTENKEYYGGDIKWLVSGDIHQGDIYDCKGRITKLGLENSNTKILPINSVLIALNGQGKTRGTVAFLKTEAACNQSIAAFVIRDEQMISPYYLYLDLKQRYLELRNLTGDNERSGLNLPILRSLDLSVPPINIQINIAEQIQSEMQAVEQCKLLKTQMENKIKEVMNSLWQTNINTLPN